MDIKKALFIKKNKYMEVDCRSKDTDLLDKIAKYLEQGFNIVQINSTDIADSAFLKLAKNLRQLTSIYEAVLIIKNRADITELACADGIMLDNDSVGITECKKLLNNALLFGSNSASNTDGFDFCITDRPTKKAKIPTFYKIKKEDNITIYRINYDNSK